MKTIDKYNLSRIYDLSNMKEKGKNSLDRGESTRGTDELGKNELFELVLHDIGGFGRFQVITTVLSINVIRKDPYLVSANTLSN